MPAASGLGDALFTPATTANTLHSPARPSARASRDPRSEDRTRRRVAHRARDEDLARAGEAGDLRADRYRDPSDLAVVQRALAGVKIGADPEADRLDPIADGGRRLDRLRRPVEGGEEPVVGGVELDAAESPVVSSESCDAKSGLRQRSRGQRERWLGSSVAHQIPLP